MHRRRARCTTFADSLSALLACNIVNIKRYSAGFKKYRQVAKHSACAISLPAAHWKWTLELSKLCRLILVHNHIWTILPTAQKTWQEYISGLRVSEMAGQLTFNMQALNIRGLSLVRERYACFGKYALELGTFALSDANGSPTPAAGRWVDLENTDKDSDSNSARIWTSNIISDCRIWMTLNYTYV